MKIIFLLLAFYTGESVDGLNKVCYYDSPKGQVAITIPAHRMCPMTIDI